VRAKRVGGRIEATFDDRAHQVESSTRGIRLVAQAVVRGTRRQAEAAVDAREEPLALLLQHRR
jgi:hypothetical protein